MLELEGISFSGNKKPNILLFINGIACIGNPKVATAILVHLTSTYSKFSGQ